MKKKSNMTNGLFAATFLITIIALVTTVNAYPSNCILFIAKGDDLDINEINLNAINLMVGKIELDENGEPTTARVIFHQKIYDGSGKKVYMMQGIFKGTLVTKHHSVACPVFGVNFINVWFFLGEGKYRTTDTDLDLTYRNLFDITMPNTGGKYESVPMLMFLSPTGEYEGGETPIGGWVLTAVLCGIMVETPMGELELPIGPLSYLTKSWGL
jgi:hypothetical protein